MNRLLVALCLGALAMTCDAVAPLTPRLSSDTRAELLAGLAGAGLPEVAHNSIVVAITGALGLQPADAVIDYAVPYPHLPAVRGRVVRVSDRCASVEARAWLPAAARGGAVLIRGTYCLVGRAEWSAANQVVEPSPP
ncbi:hypothetical protein QFW77_02585 [Luteimonas sp. RD2P54]|uniref:Lipoprotein n=1 Tax=Luteimonas endophytica TaxID=3042023 RepID=A0ABT6J4Y8_9GAMM|nr:hypothetical protein [Luteimonas endophytica]MDH5821882.1 hypothetical protein [Luteimonas endophytica]